MEPEKNLLFVTGKGGAGKTFMAGILAARASADGKNVLLIDSEASGALARQFEHAQVGYEPVEVANKVHILSANTDDALSEYLKLYAKIPSWAKITPLARLIDLVAHAAPGVKEILIAGKICYEAQKINNGESQFDLIIVDAPSSGHVISLLDAPNALSELVNKGVIQDQTQWMKEILESDSTGVAIVTTADDIVLNETQELIDHIENSTRTEIDCVILNRDHAYDDLADVEIKTASKLMKNIAQYFETLVLQSNNARKNFAGYALYSFPNIEFDIAPLRSLMKYVKALKAVN